MIKTQRVSTNRVAFLMIEVRGVLTGSVVAEGMAALNRYPEYAEGIPVLWDLRLCDLSRYTTEEMRVTNAHLAKYPGRRNARSASLLADEGSMLLARLWSVYGTEKYPQVRKAFLDFGSAADWLAGE